MGVKITLDEMERTAIRRWDMATRLGCSPETVEHFGRLFDSVSAAIRPIRAAAKARAQRIAKDRGWVPCEIHDRPDRGPEITCPLCRSTNEHRQGGQ